MKIRWFKKALRACGVWFVSTQSHFYVPCPGWQHAGRDGGVIKISKSTQKGRCNSCTFAVHSFPDAIASFELALWSGTKIELPADTHVIRL